MQKAREERIVEITIHPPTETSHAALEKHLEEKYGLKKAVVVPFCKQKYPQEELIRALAISAGKAIKELVPCHHRIGIGWGKTVYQTVLTICSERSGDKQKFPVKRELTVLPLIGSLGQSLPYYQVNTMIDRLAEYFRAKSRFLNVPALSPKESVIPELMLENYESVRKIWETIDLAIIGLGGPIQSSEIIKAEIDREILFQLLKQQAVGDILGRFFDKRGEACQSGLESRLLGMDLETLRKIKDVVCVCGGKNKAQAIQVALENRFFNRLITDQQTAGIL